MAIDFDELLELPQVLRSLEDQARQTGLRLPDSVHLEPFTIGFMGPVDSGKTAIIRALLCLQSEQLSCLLDRLGLDTLTPVEYSYGSNWRVYLITGSHPGQEMQMDPQDQGLWETPDLLSVRVELPEATLTDWGIRIVELPSVESDQDGPVWPYNCDGVFYVLPGRGVSEADLLSLERLRRRGLPVLVIQNLREKELLPSRSFLKVERRYDLATNFPYVCPLLAFRENCDGRREQGKEERSLLRYCIALLRLLSAPKQPMKGLLAGLESSVRDLRRKVSAELEAICKTSRSRSVLENLYAVRDLLHFESRLQNECLAEQALVSARRTVYRCTGILSADVGDHLLKILNERVRDYNVEAGSKPLVKMSQASPVVDFCGRFVDGRREFCGFLENMLDMKSVLDLTEEEVDKLRRYLGEATSGQGKIAVLGRFSSGKSSLINALLGVRVNDHEHHLLPTHAGPETSTINYLDYADQRTLKAVRWLPSPKLRFLTQQNKDPEQYRVHNEEIQACHTWLEKGSVATKDFRVETSAGKFLRSRQPFDSLMEWLKTIDEPKHFAYLPWPENPCAVSVEIGRFDNDPAWAENTTLDQALDQAKKPEVGLRIESLHIGFDHPLLKHVTIIDTPGSDAPIPHHHRKGLEIVHDLECPVIYCFHSSQPGGQKDKTNITDLLGGIGKTDLSRFFFVITRCGDLCDAGRREVLKEIKKVLFSIGLNPKRLYFTEVVRELNKDFEELKRDVGEFVENSHVDRFAAWIQGTKDLVQAVCDRQVRNLIASRENEQQRQLRLTELRRQATALGGLAAELESSNQWGLKWASGRVQSFVADELNRLDELFAGLKAPKDFISLIKELPQHVTTVNLKGRIGLRSTCDAMSGKLESLVAEQLSAPALGIRRSISAPELVIQGNPFPIAGVLESLQQAEWDNAFISFIWGTEEKAKSNRSLVVSFWHTAKRHGQAALKVYIEEHMAKLQSELKRVSEDMGRDILEHMGLNSPEDILAIEARRDRAADWVCRLAALQEKYGTEPLK